MKSGFLLANPCYDCRRLLISSRLLTPAPEHWLLFGFCLEYIPLWFSSPSHLFGDHLGWFLYLSFCNKHSVKALLWYAGVISSECQSGFCYLNKMSEAGTYREGLFDLWFQRFYPCCFLMCIEEAYNVIDDGKAKLVHLMTWKGGAGQGRDRLHSPFKDIPWLA